MKIRFVTPPLELRKGGIENAVEGLRAALEAAGETVVDEGDPGDREAVHHFHGLWNPRHARLAVRLRRDGLPYVVSPHGMLEPWAFQNRGWKKRPYFALVERRFLLGARALFVTSRMERDHLREVLDHPRVEVLPLGCRDPQGPDHEAARRGSGWRAEEKVLLFLSRLDPKKGLHLLFDALARVGNSHAGWRLVVVGDGPPEYVAALKKQADELRERIPPVEWVGPVWGAERWRFLQDADLFCLPTHSENFGIAVLEALHVGTPVLTTSGTPWKDHDDLDGVFICDPEVDSLSHALNAACDGLEAWQVQDRQRLADWAAGHFSWARLAGDYIKAYRRVKKGGRDAGPDEYSGT